MPDATPPPGWSADLAAWTLVRAYHLVGRIFYATLAPHGLTPQTFGVLVTLVEQPGVSQAAIARAVLATPQSVGELLRSMEEAGLVDREPPAGRGLPARISISAAGKERLDRVTTLVLEAAGPAGLGLDDEESVVLNALLTRVVTHLTDP